MPLLCALSIETTMFIFGYYIKKFFQCFCFWVWVVPMPLQISTLPVVDAGPNPRLFAAVASALKAGPMFPV
jgi:hypothetical protein